MSFADCIRRAMGADATQKERGEAATELWREAADRYERAGYSRHMAEQAAAEDVEAVLRQGLKTKRHTTMAQLSKMRENFLMVQNAEKKWELPLRVIEFASNSPNRNRNVVAEMNALRAQFNADLQEAFRYHSRDIKGSVRNKAMLKDVMRELNGEGSTSPQAKAVASAVRDSFERMRLLFNAAGGDIGKLEYYDIPHKHDRRSIIEAGATKDEAFDNWFKEIAPLLDWSKIQNYATRRPFSADGRPPPADVQRGFLSDIFDTIYTDGINKQTVTWSMKQGRALHNKHSDPRILHFKNADAWMKYNERFGSSGPFEAIMGHAHAMARDIAMMRVLGPSHTTGLQNVYDYARKALQNDPKGLDKLDGAYKKAQTMLDDISGRHHVPAANHQVRARFFSGVRQVMSAAHLGSAMLVSMSDSVAMGLAARSIGMNPRNPISRHVNLMASSATRESAARMGYIADTLADAGNTMARFMGEAPSSEWSERLNGFVMRAQGLAFWTDMGRIAFQMEFAGALADARTLGDLDPQLAKALRQRGITDEDWALFANRDHHFVTDSGERFASPYYWKNSAVQAGMDVEQAERIALTIEGLGREYGEIAVPSINYEARATLGGWGKPGTIAGELERSMLSYKSYALTFTINQARQFMAAPTPMRKGEYMMAGLAMFTVMGAVGVQLKEVAKGNDPRPMDQPNFWAAAFLQGGGAGVAGDLFNAAETRIGGGLANWIAGPMVNLAQDSFNLTAGNAVAAMRGDEANAGRDLTRFLSRYTPGSTFWPTRAAMDRMLWDQMQKILDPEADAEMRKQINRQRTDYGNQSYWQPGEMLPDRAPSFNP
jgi:hypothetical protein